MRGEKINNWEIISEKFIRKFGRYYIEVKCTCGSEINKLLPKHHYVSKLSKGCEKCCKFHTSKGYGLISGEYWSAIKHGADKRNLSFNITIKDGWELYLQQNKKCKLSGLDIIFESNNTHNRKLNNRTIRTASLDRIDSNIGYELNNIQWVHKDVNIMKNKFNQNYFLQICSLICNNQK